MNRKLLNIYIFLFIGIAFCSCSNQSPEASIITPVTGDEFSIGETITIIVNAKDPDGKVDAVEIMAGNELLTTLYSIPFMYEWDTEGYEAGAYTITASAFDDDGDMIIATVDVSIVENEAENAGNYFPLEEGYSWDYAGDVEVVSRTTGAADENINANVAGTRRVLPKQTLDLSTGTFDVFPVTDHYYSLDNNYDLDIVQTRYFENKDGITYLRAFEDNNGTFVEVSNPVYIKGKIVEGDEWETDPVIDLNTMLNLEGIEFTKTTIKSKIYVIGNENLEISGTDYETIRLEQQVDATLKGTLSMDGYTYDIDYVIDERIVMNLVEDTGMVKSEINYHTFTITFKVDGIDIIEIGLTGVEAYELDNYKISAIPEPANEVVSYSKSATLKKENPQAELIALANKINRLVSYSCTLY
ncbi:MAG: hypothetical protein K9H26_03100 [Prolixibacteraceae bacterium]|nr:hypothetical protein [Prolixibacteraceae bacterium]